MRVLYFMNHVGQGGAALALYDLIVELKKGYNIDIVVCTGKASALNTMLVDIGVENYVIPYKNFMSNSHNPKWLWKILFRIRHDVYLPFAINKIERCIDLSTINIIHSNLNRIDIGAIISKRHNIPHIWHIREQVVGGFDLLSIYGDAIGYMTRFKSDYIVISEAVKRTWNSYGLLSEKLRLIYDGIDNSKLYASEKKKIQEMKVIFLGGYDPSKGQEQLLDAILCLAPQIRSKLKVDFYGNGLASYKAYLLNKVQQNNLSEIINIFGYDSDIYKKLNQYDVGINCSKNEGFGRVTVEYMFSGLCPIVSNQGANTELVENNKTGCIYNYGDIKHLAEIIESLINNRGYVLQMAANAAAFAKDKFTIRKHAYDVFKLYNELIIE